MDLLQNVTGEKGVFLYSWLSSFLADFLATLHTLCDRVLIFSSSMRWGQDGENCFLFPFSIVWKQVFPTLFLSHWQWIVPFCFRKQMHFRNILMIVLVRLHYVFFFLLFFFFLWSTFSIVCYSNKPLQLYHKFNRWTWRASNEKCAWCHNLQLWWLMPQQRRWMVLVKISKWSIPLNSWHWLISWLDTAHNSSSEQRGSLQG